MVTHYDKKTIEDFQLQLNQVQSEVPNTFSLRGVIEASLDAIQQARDRHISWDTIARVLQHSAHANGYEVEIQAATVRKYFVAFTSRSRAASRKKAGKKGDCSSPIAAPHSKPVETPNGIQPHPDSQTRSTPLETSSSRSPNPELETLLDTIPSDTFPTAATHASSTTPGWTHTGWTEPTFNRNRARPKPGDTYDSRPQTP